MNAARLSLYFVRHGQTEWSLSGQHTGRSDIPLTSHGEEEARTLLPRLQSVQFAHVLTSPLQRARRTCAVAGLSAQAAVEPELAEWDYGDFEGKRSVDIRRQAPDWIIFRDGCPGGELPADIASRADRLIARLENMSGNVALFSHGQFGMVLAARWIGLAVIDAQHFQLDTASVSVFGYSPSHPDVRVIALLNHAASVYGQP